jgi:hypothetical protein
MKLSFEWDEEEARTNLKKHRVSFDEATTVFTDACSTTIHDPDHQNGNFMKKPMARVKELESTDMRAGYDFRRGARGKHSKAMQAGYTITIHKADGTTMVKDVMPKEGAVVLEPEVQAYFPDSDSVNRTLRCLIPLLPQKRRARTKKS